MSWKKFDVTLAAGEAQPIYQPGEWVAFRESTGELLVSLPTGDVAGHMGEGERVRMKRFTSILLRNETGSSVTSEVIVSDEEFIPSPTLTLSSSTPAESIWDPDITGNKPRIISGTRALSTYVTVIDRSNDLINGGLEGTTTSPRTGGMNNRVHKRSNYHALHNENAAFHGISSDKVRPWAFDAQLTPVSGKYSYLEFSNNAASDVVLFLDEVWINAPMAYLTMAHNAGSGSNQATAFTYGGKFTSDDIGTSTFNTLLAETYAVGSSLSSEISSYYRYKILEQGSNKLSRPLFMPKGSSIGVQSAAVNDMDHVHISGWVVDSFAFDTPPDVETI